ncbi:hypothetical protein BDZ89DRAFT_1070715 [Hymenopellis radicata]|nr:hypothetical protein BDZ89DRAFT_1070715 [Hymenopellis radicata]
MAFSSEEPWCFTVLRSRGVQHLRPEKAWRPVITIQLASEGHEDCDASSCHELMLGSDGQNPNQKELISMCVSRPIVRFYLRIHRYPRRDATHHSKLAIKVWHRSQTKKKSKKRNLVAHSTMTFGELWKKQTFDIRLNALSPSRKTGKGSRLGIYPTLSMRMHAPSAPVIEAIMSDDDDDDLTLSPVSTMPPTPPPENDHIIMPPMDEKELEQRLRPYCLDADDDVVIVGVDCAPMNEVPAVLPQYSERDPASTSMGIMQRFISTFTLYDELRRVSLEDQYEPIFRRQLSEWTYVGGCLIALASVDAAVFAISDDSLFAVTPIARASGLGIVCTAWFILRYNFAPTPVISTRARDVFDSYFFFSISSRMPVVCMLISGGALMVFLVLVAWESWPEGVMLVSAFVGTMMTLQFFVWGFLKLGLVMMWVARVIGLVWLMKKMLAGLRWIRRLGKRESVSKEETATDG